MPALDPVLFGARLRRLREQRGLSLRDLSRRTAGQELDGVPYPQPIGDAALSRLETGSQWRTRPHPLTVQRLAAALDVSLATLLGEGPVTLRDFLLDYQEQRGTSDAAMAALLHLSEREWLDLRRGRPLARPWSAETLAAILQRLPGEASALVLDELRRLRLPDAGDATAEAGD